MSSPRIRTRSIRVAPLVCMLAFAAMAAPDGDDRAVAQLQAAFEAEMNQNARYLAFAEQATAEGRSGTATLFRASAMAEVIHARNLADVIRSLGAEPVARLGGPTVGTTEENLRAALAEEELERDEIYPALIEMADRLGMFEAELLFECARDAEAAHARLWVETRGEIGSADRERVVYVCPVCGLAVASIDSFRCPACATKTRRFIKVG